MEFILIYILLAVLCVTIGILAFMLNEFYIDFREFKNKIDHTDFDKFL
jgi:uncharacterized protein YneF (UPF0154 family)